MDPWHVVVQAREEVRQGRSFNPDEFAIHLEQVVSGRAPADYRDPEKFFARTSLTRALREHAGMVLRRLAGQTTSTAPVLTLVTQFGGGKTHTLTALYHLATSAGRAGSFDGVPELLASAQLPAVPEARVAVFVGNAWDPQEGRETPWIDVARSLAGEQGVALLGPAARTTPPGTETLGKVFAAAGKPVLVLFDEVLNLINRHRGLAEPFHAFIQNLTVAMTGTTHGAAVISLPRSQVEMTDWDIQWQERITKVVKRVAKDLIANDEAEIGEVVRRRLFEGLGDERARRRVAKGYADWCFERRSELPPEWTAVDSAATEAKARQFLQGRFEASYPFHPATLSVFQRKWQALPQYQQTRGTLAMLAQWVSRALEDAYQQARRDPLIALGSGPLESHGFRNVVLGQLGEPRLSTAIDSDIAGPLSHARALDADTRGALKGIHRRVGTAIFFESSGGLKDKVAHSPELRFAVGGPDVDTTSVDTAAFELEARAYHIRKVGTDGFQIQQRARLRKVVSDRRASLDDESEVVPATLGLVRSVFERRDKPDDARRAFGWQAFPGDSTDIPDSPRLTVIALDPAWEWSGKSGVRERLAEWTRNRGSSPRLYPGALVWSAKKPGRELREKVEHWLAWKRVKREIEEGTLGADFDPTELRTVQTQVREAEEAARDEVWAGYRFVVLFDPQESDGLREINLGAGHASGPGETLAERVVAHLKTQALLNEAPGAAYLERKWPLPFRESGAWPLQALRQAFLNGALDRVVDPDAYLRGRIPQFVANGDLGLASGPRPDGTYERVWFEEGVDSGDVVFEPGVFLLKRATAQSLKKPREEAEAASPLPSASPDGTSSQPTLPIPPPVRPPGERIVRLSGQVPSELWNKIGLSIVTKLKGAGKVSIGVDLEVVVSGERVASLEAELRQVLEDSEPWPLLVSRGSRQG